MISNVDEPLKQKGIDREYLCHIGCFDCMFWISWKICRILSFDFRLARTNSCVDTHKLGMPNNNSKTGFGYIHRPGEIFRRLNVLLEKSLNLWIGHACAGTEGYCDVFGKCRAVDAEGPLSRLKNKILSEENIHTLKDIVQVCFEFEFCVHKMRIFRIIGGHYY